MSLPSYDNWMDNYGNPGIYDDDSESYEYDDFYDEDDELVINDDDDELFWTDGSGYLHSYKDGPPNGQG